MGAPRRGTIYIITLGLSLLVATLATAGLFAVRAQRNRSELLQHMVQARLNAQSSLEIALWEISQNESWRNDLANAELPTTGTSGFIVTDPVDGDLTADPLDPILITATGVSGPATQKIEVRLEARQPGLRCLEPVIHGNDKVKFDSTTLTGDRLVSSNEKLSAKDDSQIYVDAEATDEIKADDSSVFHAGTTTEGDWPREMPLKPSVLDYYLQNGTQIDFLDLPLWGAEQIVNPDMADGTTSWLRYLCYLSPDSEPSQTPWSIRVYGRWMSIAGPYQDVTDVIQSGETYALSADVRAIGGGLSMRIDLWIKGSESDSVCFSTAWTAVDSSFTTIEGNVTPTWTGTLESAFFLVRSEFHTNGFKLDDASLRVANTPEDSRIIHRVVLGPENNPYGADNTNPQGIYVIDCLDDPIVVKDCRVVGTLVLLGQDGNDSQIRGSINWEPAVFSADPSVPNLPILLSNRNLRFYSSASDLSEELVNINFNPPGVPYAGNGDSDKADVYPSIFNGIVYTKRKIFVESYLRIHGALVGNGPMEFTDANVTATYQPVYYWYNAPPGFQDDIIMEIVPGSFRRVVDY